MQAVRRQPPYGARASRDHAEGPHHSPAASGIAGHRVGTADRVHAQRRLPQRVVELPERHLPRHVRGEGDCGGARTLASAQVLSDTRWYCISSIRRFHDLDMPLAWTDIYVDPKYASVVKRRDHGRTPVHQQIEKMFGVVIGQAQLEIFPSAVSPKHARALKVEPHSPAMTIIRRYMDRAATILRRRSPSTRRTDIPSRWTCTENSSRFGKRWGRAWQSRPRAQARRWPRRASWMPIITFGGGPILPGYPARCSPASLDPTSRSVATTRSRNISPTPDLPAS